MIKEEKIAFFFSQSFAFERKILRTELCTYLLRIRIQIETVSLKL